MKLLLTITVVALSFMATVASQKTRLSPAVFSTEPSAITLSVEASKQFTEIQRAKAELQRQYNELTLREQLVLADEGVPKAERGRKWSLLSNGTIVLLPPEKKK